MEVKPGYKQTEVGVIPEEWEVKRLNEVTDLQVGFAFKSEWFGKHIGTRLLRGENVGYGSADWSDTRTLNIKQEEDFGDYLLKPGDVVIGMDRTFTKTGSKITLISYDDCPCLLVQRVGRFIPRKCELNFLWFVLSSETVQARLRLEQKGMDIPHLSRAEILHPVAVIPPSSEQHAIAAALSDVDGLLGGLDRLIAKKRDLKQAAMQQLLTGQTRLPGFHGEWEVKPLSDVCWFQEGPGVRNTQFTKTGVKLLNGTNIFQGRINLDTTGRFISEEEAHGTYAHFLADSGDIVIACSGISVEKFHEKVAVVTPAHLPVCMNTSTMRFKPSREHLVREYFCHFLMSDSFKRQIAPQATGSAQLNFGPSHVVKVELPVPPLPEQTAIAEALSEMNEELAVLEQRREKTRALKQAMMQELLTGRTRLVSPSAATKAEVKP